MSAACYEGLITLHSLSGCEWNIHYVKDVKDVQEWTVSPDVWRYSQLSVYSSVCCQGCDRLGPELPLDMGGIYFK